MASQRMQVLQPPRPLKSSSSSSIKQQQQQMMASYEVQSMEDLISLMENVASALSTGNCCMETLSILSKNMRTFGVKLEIMAKDTLDRAFVSFRNASQDDRLSIMTRLNLLELIELRAKGWQSTDDINQYYRQKASTFEVIKQFLSYFFFSLSTPKIIFILEKKLTECLSLVIIYIFQKKKKEISSCVVIFFKQTKK